MGSNGGESQKTECVNVSFSVHSHDQDGDVYESGIYLHFGHTRVRVAGGRDGFRKFMERLERLEKEIHESYPDD